MDPSKSATWLVQCVSVVMLSVVVNAVPELMNAQQRPSPVSFDVGTGIFSARGNSEYVDRSGFSIAGQLTGRVLSGTSRSLLAAFNVSGYSNLDTTDDCVVPVNQDGSSGQFCTPSYPSATVFALMVGVEQRLQNIVAFRVLAGPARFRTTEYDKGTGSLVRADVSLPARSHVSFLVWGQYAFNPRYQLPNERVLMTGIGMRLQ